jgi:dUTP pyrophosphatase
MSNNKEQIIEVKENQLYFAKIKPNAIIPSKDIENGGYDIYACFEEDYIDIPSHTTKMIPTGISSACSEDYVIILKERGSTGTKGIAQRCGVIDSGYRGEWFIPLTNTTDNTITISKKGKQHIVGAFVNKNGNPARMIANIQYPYEKAICQALIIPVPKMNVKEISYEQLQSIPSKRGVNKLGSSGK